MRKLKLAVALSLIVPSAIGAQEGVSFEMVGDSVSFQFVDADLRMAIHTLAAALDRPLVFGQLGEHRLTMHMPSPIHRAILPGLLRGLLPQYGLALTENPEYYLVGAPLAEQEPETSDAGADLQLFVIEIRHAQAADVAATLSALYGQPQAFGERPSPRPTISESLKRALIPPVDADAGDEPLALTQQPAVLSAEVRIIPDPRTNSLLVRASRRDFDLIHATVEQLDVRPLQVLIEVVIAEVRRDRSLAFGTGIAAGPSTLPGHPDTEVAATIPGAGLGDFVLSVLHLGRVDLAVTLSAAASRGDVTILSRPVLLAANNETAEILVGSQRPFVQVQRALPTDAPVRDQVVQFKDVGTRLTVMPTVSQDGYVMLQVVQEVSAATAEVAFDAPVISTRSIQTRLLVRDGHTAILGGLADRQRDVTRSGVPVLAAIPVIGGVFGRHAIRTTETELFVFLTPRVLRSDEDLDEASQTAGDRTRRLRNGSPDREHNRQ
jgi:type II secretory pathway component GspD/PulD (secretin)